MRKYRKPYRVKRKKPIFRKRFLWLGILAIIIGGTVFYFLFFSEAFQVKKIIITGEEKVSKYDLKLLIEGGLQNRMLFFETKSIFLVDAENMREDILDDFPQIAEIEISRGFPDALNIVVVERLGLAVWCGAEKCFLLDNEGVIFEETSPETDLIKFTDKENIASLSLGEKVIEKEKLTQILDIRSKLRKSLKVLIVEASIIFDERINTKTSEGWEIYFNPKGDLDWQITELGLVLEKLIPPEKREGLEYIDLRFSRVFYK